MIYYTSSYALVLAVVCAGTAAARGYVGLYTDRGYTNSNLIDYGSCTSGSVLIVADPASPSGSVEAIDCTGGKWLVACDNDFREMRINSDGSCQGGPG